MMISLGEFELCPVADNSVMLDSNCVINLSPISRNLERDCPRSQTGAGRRFRYSFMKPLPEDIQTSSEALWVVLRGAVLVEKRKRWCNSAGLTDADFEEKSD
jgi:hypothetical protein